MKKIKKSKVITKKVTKVVNPKKRKVSAMVKSVNKKIKKPTKITSVKKIVKKPKKVNKLKLDITYESKNLSEINVPRTITSKDVIVINELDAINKEVEELTEKNVEVAIKKKKFTFLKKPKKLSSNTIPKPTT
jgi:hypothetical protein